MVQLKRRTVKFNHPVQIQNEIRTKILIDIQSVGFISFYQQAVAMRNRNLPVGENDFARPLPSN